MKLTLNRVKRLSLAVILALVATVSLSGCIWERDDDRDWHPDRWHYDHDDHEWHHDEDWHHD